MYLNSITANVLNKFNNQQTNILYQPQNNLFDAILAECGFSLFFDSAYNFSGTEKTNMTMINQDQMSLFNYNVGITNNMISYASNQIFSNFHLNSIIFSHSYKPKQIKKEDLLLINNSLQRENKIFFTADAAESWDLITNKTVLNYGIPTEKLYQTQDFNDRDNKVLLLNFESSSSTESLANLLESNKIQLDLIKNISVDLNAIRGLFNRYKVVIDFNEHNIINLMCAISCGCKCITYASEMINQNFAFMPNLFAVRSVQDAIDQTHQCLGTDQMVVSDYIEKNFPFAPFKESITNIVNKANKEVFVL